jgi:hypothetical protein
MGEECDDNLCSLRDEDTPQDWRVKEATQYSAMAS